MAHSATPEAQAAPTLQLLHLSINRQCTPTNPSVVQRARQRAAGQMPRPPVALNHDTPHPWWVEADIAWSSPEMHAEPPLQPTANREAPSPRRAHAAQLAVAQHMLSLTADQ